MGKFLICLMLKILDVFGLLFLFDFMGSFDNVFVFVWFFVFLYMIL